MVEVTPRPPSLLPPSPGMIFGFTMSVRSTCSVGANGKELAGVRWVGGIYREELKPGKLLCSPTFGQLNPIDNHC